MNVTFKIMRRSGDKAYILSEITDYDKGLPVVLSASTENGVRIPCDVFPFVDEDDVLAMEFALYDTALAVRDDLLASAHAKNSPALRFFVVVLPWLNVKRWVLEFRAITPEGKTQSFCVNGLEMDAFRWRNRLDIRRGAFQSEALDMGDRLLVSAALDMPYHEESDIAFDFLDGEGRPFEPYFNVIEDSVTHASDFGSLERRNLELSISLPKAIGEMCVCATDTAGTIAPGFEVLSEKGAHALLEEFAEQTRTAYNDPAYDEWYRTHQRADLPTLFEQVSVRFKVEPLISIVCVLDHAQHHQIHDVMNAFRTQSYSKWELIFVDLEGDDSFVSSLLEVFQDDRMYLVDVDPALSRPEKINAAFYAAEGSYIGSLFAHDLLAPNALFECVRTINAFPTCELIYCDSDTVNVQGYHSHPILRSAYSPELLRSFNYLGNFVIYGVELLERIGLLDPAFEGALAYDLNLRACEQAQRVCHISRVLCHRRFASEMYEYQLHSPEDQEAGRKALVAHCKRVGISAEVLSLDIPFCYRIRHVLTETPKVSIVLNTVNNADVIERCVTSLYQQISYDNFEVVVVEVGKLDALQTMLGYFQDEQVGIVGPQKLYLDATIEHAGLVVGGEHVITPISRYMLSDWNGYLDRCAVSRNVSAVAGECMFISKEVFDQVGGFTEDFSLAYSDVDFCLKARELGFYTVYTPYVKLTHSRSVNRMRNYSQAFLIKRTREAALIQYLWPDYFVKGDGFYNPNLDPNNPYFALRKD